MVTMRFKITGSLHLQNVRDRLLTTGAAIGGPMVSIAVPDRYRATAAALRRYRIRAAVPER